VGHGLEATTSWSSPAPGPWTPTRSPPWTSPQPSPTPILGGPPAGRLGACRARLRHRTGHQRTRHQRPPVRTTTDPAPSPQRRQPDLRGLRSRQHRLPHAPRSPLRRRRTWAAPSRPADPPLRHPPQPAGQDEVIGAVLYAVGCTETPSDRAVS